MAQGDVTTTTLDNAVYALVDLGGPDFYRYPGAERDEVGIPLDDLLIARPGESPMMSMKGEETLRDIDAPVVDDYEEVDTLFRISAWSGAGAPSGSPARGRPGESGMPEQSPVRCGSYVHFSVNGQKD